VTEEERSDQQAPEEGAEQAAGETPAEAPAPEEAAAEEGSAPAEDAPAEPEPAAEEAVEEQSAKAADEASAAEAPDAGAAAAPAAEAEPEEQLSPKQRRKRGRALHRGEAHPPRSSEERARERAEERRRKAGQRRRWRVRVREKKKATPSGEPLPPLERAQAKPRVRQGVVVSDKADRTITVRIDAQRQHRTYGKIVRTSSTLHAHDERNEAHTGDTVRIVESRPLSRTKRWRLVEILERAK
jgi:small subunit ribosomal protein S17